jgi:hypothetical protein
MTTTTIFRDNFFQSDLETINKLCQLDKEFNEFCSDEHYWPSFNY